MPPLPDAALLPRLPLGAGLSARPPRKPAGTGAEGRGTGRRAARLTRLARAVAACRACPTMAPYRKFPAGAAGHRDARFVLVGEAPGLMSLEHGRHWTGTGGMILRREIRRLGLDLEDLFYLTNAVKCWPAGRGTPAGPPTGNRPPLGSEWRRCRPFLLAELATLRPEAVVVVGAVAARALLDHPVRLPDDHGRRFRVDGREVIVLLHPANASRHRQVWPTYRASLLALFGELAARAGFPVVEVTAGVIRRRGRYLVTRRDPAKHLGGLWEFPGGKRQPRESLEQCLARELREELGVHATVRERLAVVPWVYPARRVLLHFFRCEIGRARIRPRERQPWRWVTAGELRRLPMPPADAALVARLASAGSTCGPAGAGIRGKPRDPGVAARSRRPSRRRPGGSPHPDRGPHERPERGLDERPRDAEEPRLETGGPGRLRRTPRPGGVKPPGHHVSEKGRGRR